MDQYQKFPPEQFEVEQPPSPIKSSHVRLHVGLIMFSVVLVILLMIEICLLEVDGVLLWLMHL